MKGDLNLLQKKESKVSPHVLFLGSVLVISLISVIGYFFVYIPNDERSKAIANLNNKKAQLASYTGINEEYDAVLGKIKILKGQFSVIESLGSMNVKLTERIAHIGQGIPVNIIIDSISYTSGVMDIAGVADDMETISQFMVNLRKMDHVIGVQLSHAIQEEEEQSKEDAESNEIVNKYRFKLTVIYTFFTTDDIQDNDQPEEGGGE